MQNRRQRRKRTQKKSINIFPKHIFFLLFFLTGAIVFVSYRFPETLQPVRDGIDSFISPMQRGINVVGRSVSDYITMIEDLKILQQENEQLKEKIEQLTLQSQIISQEKYELDALRELYELDQKYSDYKKVAANIIARESNGWYNIFTIDKGYEDGILEDMNVMAGNGLVGITTSTLNNSLICSPYFSLTADSPAINKSSSKFISSSKDSI